MISEGHVDKITDLSKELLEGAKLTNESLNKLRQILSENHNTQADKSCLKSSLGSYLKMIPEVNVTGLQALLDKDAHICKQTLEKSKENFNTFQQTYTKFINKQ